MKLLRQDPEYIYKKKEKMAVVNLKPQQASLRAPPLEFWEHWRQRNRLRYFEHITAFHTAFFVTPHFSVCRYSKGIDKTKGCTSTTFMLDSPALAYDLKYIQQRRLSASASELGTIVRSDGSELLKATTSGQAVTMLRQRKKYLVEQAKLKVLS